MEGLQGLQDPCPLQISLGASDRCKLRTSCGPFSNKKIGGERMRRQANDAGCSSDGSCINLHCRRSLVCVTMCVCV